MRKSSNAALRQHTSSGSICYSGSSRRVGARFWCESRHANFLRYGCSHLSSSCVRPVPMFPLLPFLSHMICVCSTFLFVHFPSVSVSEIFSSRLRSSRGHCRISRGSVNMRRSLIIAPTSRPYRLQRAEQCKPLRDFTPINEDIVHAAHDKTRKIYSYTYTWRKWQLLAVGFIQKKS